MLSTQWSIPSITDGAKKLTALTVDASTSTGHAVCTTYVEFVPTPDMSLQEFQAASEQEVVAWFTLNSSEAAYASKVVARFEEAELTGEILETPLVFTED